MTLSSYWSGMLMQPSLFGLPVSQNVTGVSAQAIAGNVKVGIGASGTGAGVAATGALGTVLFATKGSATLVGLSCTATVNSVSGAIVENPLASGVYGETALGVIDAVIGESTGVTVTGVDCSAIVYTVSFWSDIPDPVSTEWTPIE